MGCNGQHASRLSAKASTPMAGRRAAIDRRDGSGVDAVGLRTSIRFDRAADQLDNLVACRDQGNVRVAALDLRPVVAGLAAEARGILPEGLVQNADHDDLSLGSGRGLREILKEIDVVAEAQGRGLEELAHFVDDEEDAVVSLIRGRRAQFRDDFGGGIGRRR